MPERKLERDGALPCFLSSIHTYAFPLDTHFPKDVVRTTDVYRRWMEWMTKHLK